MLTYKKLLKYVNLSSWGQINILLIHYVCYICMYILLDIMTSDWPWQFFVIMVRDAARREHSDAFVGRRKLRFRAKPPWEVNGLHRKLMGTMHVFVWKRANRARFFFFLSASLPFIVGTPSRGGRLFYLPASYAWRFFPRTHLRRAARSSIFAAPFGSPPRDVKIHRLFYHLSTGMQRKKNGENWLPSTRWALCKYIDSLTDIHMYPCVCLSKFNLLNI